MLLHLQNRRLLLVLAKNTTLLIHHLNKVFLCSPSQAAITRKQYIQLLKVAICGFWKLSVRYPRNFRANSNTNQHRTDKWAVA